MLIVLEVMQHQPSQGLVFDIKITRLAVPTEMSAHDWQNMRYRGSAYIYTIDTETRGIAYITCPVISVSMLSVSYGDEYSTYKTENTEKVLILGSTFIAS